MKVSEKRILSFNVWLTSVSRKKSVSFLVLFSRAMATTLPIYASIRETQIDVLQVYNSIYFKNWLEKNHSKFCKINTSFPCLYWTFIRWTRTKVLQWRFFNTKGSETISANCLIGYLSNRCKSTFLPVSANLPNTKGERLC